MSFSSDDLQILGQLASATNPMTYTRMITPKSLPSRYVEFLTSSIKTPAPPLPSNLGSLYVDANTPLYFSDYPAPPSGVPVSVITGVIGKGPILPGSPTAAPTGLQLYDGSPMAVQKENGVGPISGLSGTAKTGTTFSLSMSASNAVLAGRVAKMQATWVFCKADLNVGGQPQFSMSLGLCPEDLLATLSIYHQNIRSAIGLDLAPATGIGGFAKATRSIQYYGETISSVTVNMQDGSNAPVPLATSPLHQFVSQIDLMSSAIATVLGEVAGQTQVNPLTSLGTLDVHFQETEAAYINRGLALVGPACARIGLVLLGGSSIPGLANLAQWLGWSVASLGQPYLRVALTKSYTNFEAWASQLGAAGNKTGAWRSMLQPGDGVASEIVDSVFDQAWQH